jgi:PGF-pre-PGF domain-containing protein
LKVNKKETISSSSSSSSSGGSGFTSLSNTNSDTQYIKTLYNIMKGEEKEILVKSNAIPISRISFVSDDNIASVKFTLKKLDEKPGNTSDTDKIINSYLELEKSISQDFESLEIEFKVSKEWLENNSIGKQTIKLLRFVDDWKELETKIKTENSTTISYTSKTPGFSYFAIAGKEEKTPEIENREVKEEDVETKAFLAEKNSTPKDSYELVKPEPQDNNSQVFILIVGVVIVMSLMVFLIFRKEKKEKSRMKKEIEISPPDFPK